MYNLVQCHDRFKSNVKFSEVTLRAAKSNNVVFLTRASHERDMQRALGGADAE